MHPEILEDGPALVPTVATYHRDRVADPAFHRPSDHDARGMLAGGTYDTPNAENDPLQSVVGVSPEWALVESPAVARQRRENARAASNARWERQKREGASLAARQRKFVGAVLGRSVA